MSSIVWPFNLADGSIADAVQVMANLNVLRAAVEGAGSAASASDAYQAGVLSGTDWVPGGSSINGGTGSITFTAIGGAAWLPSIASGLVRTFTASAEVAGLKPATLPAAGAFMCVGVELTVSGSAATASVVSGAEQASEAEALAHSPAITSGKTRVRDVIVKNTGGVYSIVKERDRRPWALGANSARTGSTFTTTSNAFAELAGVAQRIEVSTGRVLVVSVSSPLLTTTESNLELQVTIDGAGTGVVFEGAAATGISLLGAFSVTGEYSPGAGSHLVSVRALSGASGKTVKLNEPLVRVREFTAPLNNGTT